MPYFNSYPATGTPSKLRNFTLRHYDAVGPETLTIRDLLERFALYRYIHTPRGVFRLTLSLVITRILSLTLTLTLCPSCRIRQDQRHWFSVNSITNPILNPCYLNPNPVYLLLYSTGSTSRVFNRPSP